ncbi:hypothetical protein KKD19_06890 [Patescibacteria group bacterium]|nr:hypothetical protein [Patescibacteria group bacterium]
MAKKSKFKQSKLEQKSEYIKPSSIEGDDKISFNFRRMRSDGDKFKYCDKDSRYFLKLVERLRDVCHLTPLELKTSRSSSLKCHQINFADSRCTEDGFGFNSQDIDDNGWQFEISQNEHGRIHGFFLENIFYVVWLDPKHELYPGKKL